MWRASRGAVRGGSSAAGGYVVFATTVVVEILCLALIAGALAAGLPPAAALAFGAALVALSLTPIRGRRPSVHLMVWTRHLLRRWGLRKMPALASAFDGASVGDSPDTRPGSLLARRAQSGRALSVSPRTGFRWDGTTLVCAVRIRPRTGTATAVSFNRSETADQLSVHDLSPLLDQFDIRLAGIDLVSVGVRVRASGLVAQVYRRLIGPLPAIASRDTLLLVRLDPAACPAAVARRGGGDLGAVRTAKVATARIIRALDAAGFHGELLSPAQLDESWARHTGLGPGIVPVPSWSCVAVGEAPQALSHTTYTTDTLALTSPGLARLWHPAAESTVVTVRLRPSPRPGACQLGLLVRYAAAEPVRVPESLGLRLLDGQQLDGLCATAPRAEPMFDRLCEFHEVHPASAPDLAVSTTGCGQLIGGDDAGNAVTATVVGPGVRAVEIVGEAYLARQVVLRAIALGARVLVRSDRPHSWHMLAEEIADPSRLHIAGVAGPDPRDYTAIVLDGPAPAALAPDATIITVRSEDAASPGSPDLRIRQDEFDRDRLLLEVGGRRLSISVVTIPDEARLIGQPEAMSMSQAPALAEFSYQHQYRSGPHDGLDAV